MLELVLTTADGGTPWRHLLAPGEARAGWECVGPQGLVRRVGRLLGFPTEPAPALDRLAVLLSRLGRETPVLDMQVYQNEAGDFGI